MSAKTQIDRIKGNVTKALNAIAEKGVNVPSGSNSDVLSDLIAAIGGLPNGVKAMTSGTYTAVSDVTTEFLFNHDLGVEPNFFVWFLTDSSGTKPTKNAATFGATLRLGTSILRNVNGLSATGSLTGTQTRTTINNFLTSTSASWLCNTTYKIYSGCTYRWICGVLDDVS